MSASVLDTADFWKDLGERVGRQVAQTALPIVAVVGASADFQVKPVVLALLISVAVTVLNALRKVVVTPGEPLAWQLLDRAVPAAAGVLLGFVPVDVSGLDVVDWKAAGYAAAAAAATAVLAYFVTPPSAVAVARALPDYAPLDEVL